MNSIIVNWSGEDKKALESIASRISAELNDVLKMGDRPPLTITIHDSRDSYEKRLNKKTETWEVGNASRDGQIDILHPDAFEKYSTHKKGEFSSILKHEVVHVYLRALAEDHYIPHWLNEGLANYLTHQEGSHGELAPLFIESNFTTKLSSGYDWDARVKYGAYLLARLFTKYLIDKFTFDKVIELVKDLDKNFYEPSFRTKFRNHFNVDLSEAENSFVMEINK